MRGRRFYHLLTAGAGAALLATSASAGTLTGVFIDNEAVEALDTALVPRWIDVLRRAAAQGAKSSRLECIDKPGAKACEFAEWQRTLLKLQPRSPILQLETVQSRINRLPYTADAANWQRTDYWETPREMFARGGDCEDYALTKYFALRELGYDDAAMRIAIVWDRVDAEEHAVLLVRSEGKVWLLDNKLAKLEDAGAQEARYRLIYTVHESGVRFAPPQFAATATTNTASGARRVTFAVAPRRHSSERAYNPIPFALRSPAALSALTQVAAGTAPVRRAGTVEDRHPARTARRQSLPIPANAPEQPDTVEAAAVARQMIETVTAWIDPFAA